ncbi:WD40 repeat-like protein [Suillus brevipes Sb2]|nr:WD40 repeat-like protein [Suillus brevipes Sb2]
MASSSTQLVGANNVTLEPIMTLETHEPVMGSNISSKQHRHISFISYFSDGKGMVSASNKTIRQWDLRTGTEIEKVWDVCGPKVQPWTWNLTVAVSRDCRWIVTASHAYTPGQSYDIGELKARDVKTRVVKRFEGHSRSIKWIDISPDSTLLAGGSWDGGDMWIWSLESGKLVGCSSPFALETHLGVGRFSQNSKKLAVLSVTGRCLEVWDAWTHKLDVRVEESRNGTVTETPIFWTTKDKSIVAVFDFKDWNGHPDPNLKEWDHSKGFQPHPDLNTIYEFDALTLEIVRSPFEGHTQCITGLALSFDCALLVSASRHDKTIKIWAFESRQLLASFDDRSIDRFIFSPNSYQLAYTNLGDTKIYIYDPPPDILSSVRLRPVQEAQPKVCIPPSSSICELFSCRPPKNLIYSTYVIPFFDSSTPLHDISQSDATPRAVRRKPVIARVISHVLRPLAPAPTMHPHHPAFFRYLRKLFSSSGTSAVPPVRNDRMCDPWDFPATSPIPPKHFPSAQASTQELPHMISHENPRLAPAPPTTSSPATAPKAPLSRLLTRRPIRAGDALPPIVDVPHAPAKLVCCIELSHCIRSLKSISSATPQQGLPPMLMMI